MSSERLCPQCESFPKIIANDESSVNSVCEDCGNYFLRPRNGYRCKCKGILCAKCGKLKRKRNIHPCFSCGMNLARKPPNKCVCGRSICSACIMDGKSLCLNCESNLYVV